MEGTDTNGGLRSGSLVSAAGSVDTKASVDTKNSDKVTTVSAQSDCATPLIKEASSAFVSLNPYNLFLAWRNAKIITVEPVIFLYMLGTYFYLPLYEQYYYQRYGEDQLQDTNFTSPNYSFCLNSSELDEYGGNGTYKVVQSLSTDLLTYGSLVNRVLSVIATLVMGPLSDRYGRRIVIVIVSIGMIIQGAFSLCIVYFNLNLYFFILTQAIAGITGDFSALLMACFTYVVDVGSKRWRTLRIAIAEAMLFLAGAFGEGLISGLWLQELSCNFIPPLWLYVACALGIIAYTILFLPESLDSIEHSETAKKKPSKCGSLAMGFKIMFCQFGEYAVWKLWAGLIIVFVITNNMTGSDGLAVYYFKAKLTLDWGPEKIGIYLGAQQLSFMFGLLVVLPLLMACKVPDTVISLIGMVIHIVKNVCVGLAQKSYVFFIIAAVGGTQAVMLPPLRSIMSKVVTDDRQGAVFSFVASVEVLGSLAGGTIYPQLYNFTLNRDVPIGTVFFVMSVLALLLVPILLMLLICGKRSYLCFPTATNEEGDPLCSRLQASCSDACLTTTNEKAGLLSAEQHPDYSSSPGSAVN